MFQNRNDIETILSALAEQLQEAGAGSIEIVVCGGAALSVLGYIARATMDIDIVAFAGKNSSGETVLHKAESLGSLLFSAAEKVKKDFNLNDRWINNEPSSMMDFGMPRGLMERVETRTYGESLRVHYIGRYDQIHFKLYAAADQGAGKHYDDLKALSPSSGEIESAALWAMTHDVSEGFKVILVDLLRELGFSDVADRI